MLLLIPRLPLLLSYHIHLILPTPYYLTCVSQMPSKITDPQKWQRKSSGVISIDSCIDNWSRAAPELNLSPQCQCPSRAMREKRLTTSLLKCFCLTTSLVIARENIGSWSKSLLLALLLSIRLPDNHSSTQKLSWSLSSFHDVLREKQHFCLAQIYGLFRAMFVPCPSLSSTASPQSPPKGQLGLSRSRRLCSRSALLWRRSCAGAPRSPAA